MSTTPTLTNILSSAMHLGIIDIFTVIYYQVNGLTADQIIEDIKAQHAKGGHTPYPFGPDSAPSRILRG